MAVNHLVWFKFNEGVPAERIAAHLQALQTLAAQVPGILALNLGSNFTQRAEGFTHGLVVTLRDRQALADYAVHPYHVAVATEIGKDAQVRALDYEFDPA